MQLLFSRLFFRIIVHKGGEDVLGEKKPTLTDAAEIKAANKLINALQEEFGRLREKIQDEWPKRN